MFLKIEVPILFKFSWFDWWFKTRLKNFKKYYGLAIVCIKADWILTAVIWSSIFNLIKCEYGRGNSEGTQLYVRFYSSNIGLDSSLLDQLLFSSGPDAVSVFEGYWSSFRVLSVIDHYREFFRIKNKLFSFFKFFSKTFF